MSPTPSGARTFTSIDVHAEGEVGRILLGAHLLVRGTTCWLRRLMLREPRGHPSMCGVLVLPVVHLRSRAEAEASAQAGSPMWYQDRA